MAIFKISYDAGHGYNTPGKRSPAGEREWMFNNIVAVSFANEMSKYENVRLLRVDDPTGKTDVSLTTRTNKANSFKSDIHISFHQNGLDGVWGDHTGTETYYFRGSESGYQLARAVHNSIRDVYKLRDRGLKVNSLHMTRETNMPCILTEGAFMDSRIDIKKLRDDVVLKQSGIATANGVIEYFGKSNLIKKEVEQVSKPVKKVDNTPSSWAKEAWEWGMAQGITDGSNPKGTPTREQVIAMIHRAHKIK